MSMASFSSFCLLVVKVLGTRLACACMQPEQYYMYCIYIPSTCTRVPLGLLASPLSLFHSAISLAGSLDFRVSLKALRQNLTKTST